MAKIAAADWKTYCRACDTRYKVIRRLAEQAFNGELEGRSALDWGSAVGGVAILMDHHLPLKVHAADVDPHSMQWLQKAAPTIPCTTLTPGQQLPFEQNTFDLIYGISVLTHIPPEAQAFYLAELKRICKPGGSVVLTVKSYSCCEGNRTENKDPAIHPWDREELRSKGLLYTSYDPTLLARMDFVKDEGYGITYHSREHVEAVFSQYFDIEYIEEAAIGNQDAVLMRERMEN